VQSRDLDAARRAIVNPRTLDRTRQLETCMQCHLETTSSPLPFQIRRYEHAPFTYTPGRPLGEYFIHFDHAPGTGRDDKFEIASGAYRLRKSACFLRSEMTCVTCHDPHDIPRGGAATTHYVAVCQGCHPSVHGSGPPRAAGAGPRATCIDCHMPRRRAEDAVHVVMTDHFIQRRRPEEDLLAPRRESENFDQGTYRGEVALYYPPALPAGPERELYLAIAQVQHGSNLSGGIPRLEAALKTHSPARPDFYVELARAYAKRPDHEAAIRWSEEALRRDPVFVPALKELAAAAMALGRLSPAADALERAVASQPDDAQALADLGNVYLQLRRVSDAERAVERSLALDADLPRANNTMALILVESGNLERAEEFARRAIRLQPDLAEARNNLGNMLARRRAFAEAVHEFEQALRSNPDYAEAQHSYGLVLALTQDYAKAVRALEGAIRLAPARATPHTDLANVLAAMGRIDAAAAEYERAIGLDPDEFDAHLALGEIRARQRRMPDARRHFDAAARSTDPEIRSAAVNALRSLDP
jgi:tetratricopeptide (TPR) repeat protein